MLDAAAARAEEVIASASATVVPSDLFDRLWEALDERPGRGDLWDALTRARAASDIAAALLVVVDAISTTAADFYQNHGFTPVPDNPNRLIQKMSDIAAALDAGFD